MKISGLEFRGYPKLLKKKYCKFGIDSLLDHELLELLLSFSKPRQDVRQLAESLISQYGNFQGILDEQMKDLVSFPGMDADSAIILKLSKDCSGFYLKQKAIKRYSINNGLDLIQYCRISMSGLKNEQVRIIFLDVNCSIIEIEILQEGTLDEAIVYPRRVIERALYHNASRLIFVHNHPSGRPKPSYLDKKITEKLVAAAASIDIEVLDHLIIGKTDFFSFKDAGLLNYPKRQ